MVSSDGVRLGPVPAGHQDRGVRGRRAVAGGIWGRWDLVWHWISGPLTREVSACQSEPPSKRISPCWRGTQLLIAPVLPRRLTPGRREQLSGPHRLVVTRRPRR